MSDLSDARENARDRLAEELRNGNVDACLIPWIELLNAIPGVTTAYSCEGHGGERSAHAYVILLLDRELIEAFYLWRGIFIKDAPFPVSLDFQYVPDKYGFIQERVWVNGDPDYIGEDCLTMFAYLTTFLQYISRMVYKGQHDGN